MNENEFGGSLNIEGLGYINIKRENDLHQIKSFVGKAFRVPIVLSACVYDSEGTARLYLKKTPNGVIREER